MKAFYVLTSLIATVWLAYPATSTTLFSSHQLIQLHLDAPFDELFKRARRNRDYRVTGRLSYTDESGEDVAIGTVEISERGHTSNYEGECEFPKLKLHLAPDTVHLGAFEGVSEIKLGTHCGERPDDTLTAKYGRVVNQRAAHREAFVYRLLDIVQVPSLKARPARVTYTFSDRPAGDTSREVVRDAMVLEDEDDAAKRLGGHEIEPAAFTNAQHDFDAGDAAALALAQAMIGNFDWCLKFYEGDEYRCDARHPLWNITAAVSAGRRAIPIMYDFDLAGMVTGPHPWFGEVFNEAFVPSKSRAETEVVAQVQRARSLFSRADLDRIRARFQRHKGNAFRALEESALDPAGRTQIETYLRSFYDAIDDAHFYIPVVARPNTTAYVDAQRTQQVCNGRGLVPIGTPVSAPLSASGSLVQVLLLDVMWQWGPPDRCDAVHERPVWIERSAIDSRYP